MNKIISQSWFDFDEKEEVRESIIISIVAILICLFLSKVMSLLFGVNSLISSNSQLIVGTIVNSLLIVSALNIKGLKKNMGIIIMPSIATYISGILYGSSIEGFVYMIPVIWIGNYGFIYMFKWLMAEKEMNYFLTGILAVIVKTIIIFGIFNLLNGLGVFGNLNIDILRYYMGILQGFSGILGVLLGYLIFTSYSY